MASAEQTTVIIGAGVIGCATSFYLSRPNTSIDPKSIHLVEFSNELFSSASGRSGGFLAEDWFGDATASLGALSFRLHRELARDFDGYQKWGYSPSTGINLVASECAGNKAGGTDWLRTGGSRAEAAGIHESQNKANTGPKWLLQNDGDILEPISEEDGVAQVDPLRLSRFLLDKSIEAGVNLHQPAQAMSFVRNEDAQVTGLQIRRSDDSSTFVLPCSRVLIAAGAWSPRVHRQLFPQTKKALPVASLAGHSIVVCNPRWNDSVIKATCHAVFTTLPGGDFSPEIFSRVGSEIYIAGLNDASLPLPERPEGAVIDEKCIDRLLAVSKRLLGEQGFKEELGEDVKLLRQGLCYRPVTAKGTPIIARLSKDYLPEHESTPVGGVFLAAGHGPWGISHSLGTGLVMAEMLQGMQTTADVNALGL